MRFVADLHIHSKYSRAVSKDMTLEELDRWAARKGILVMGTGDFTHPLWWKEIREKLEPAEPGLFRLKREHKLPAFLSTPAETRFLLTVEIANIYKRHGAGRRVHNLLLAPDFESAEKITTQLSWIGNVKSDGRPMLGLDSEELLKIALGAHAEAVLIPAHAWTPWYSVFGSMSGFDSLEECFGKSVEHIFAIETGLSSDPAMNWRLSSLDKIALVSNSDSHSPQRIGREANVFDTDLSYRGIVDVIRSRDPKRFLATVEFFPEEGKYHFDGHRACGVSWHPTETERHRGVCTGCGRPVTVGVMNRVQSLADRPEQKPEYVAFGAARARVFENRVPYVSLVTLDEIIGGAFGVGPQTKTVRTEYEKLVRAFGSEFTILTETSIDELAAVAVPAVVESVRRVRSGELTVAPGYDGEYGTVRIFADDEHRGVTEQSSLF
jgi:uncharacterized protein (TIGR00375 family)